MYFVTVYNARHSGINMMDNSFVVKAAQTFVDGGSPYADKRFLYFPSSVLVAVPMTAVPPYWLGWLVPALTSGMAVLGWFCAVRIFRVSLLSRLSVYGLLFLCFFAAFRNLAQLGNWTAYSALALPAALLLASRGRWVWAGVVVGLAVATKPMLVPFALIFLIARRPKAFAAAAAVPLALCALAAAVMPQPGLFFTKTLPFLLHGQDRFARPYDASIGTMLARLHFPGAVAMGVAALLALALLVGAWRRWNRGGDEALRLVEVGAMLMVAANIASKPAFDHYLLVTLPVLLASVVRVGSVARSPWLWFAIVPRMAGFTLPWLDVVEHWAYSVALVNVTVAALLLQRAFWPGTVPADEEPAEPAATAAPASAPGAAAGELSFTERLGR
ncbi:glycosyltransferase family 87 protein [Kitasatospora phosalacinea]|uniref:glycosyltransferase family 87 protein n=1 Tax=Kitasatospora phosalacinea TaxID=2065 RepID=UPI0006919922|nr:glycosyltransferase family 87 protein [Kitasatospora phosalacinea]